MKGRWAPEEEEPAGLASGACSFSAQQVHLSAASALADLAASPVRASYIIKG